VSGLIGASVPRRDAPAKVTGAARHNDNLAVPTHIVKDEYQP